MPGKSYDGVQACQRCNRNAYARRESVHSLLKRRLQRYVLDAKPGRISQLSLDLRIENIQLKRDHLTGLKRRDRCRPWNDPLSFAEMD